MQRTPQRIDLPIPDGISEVIDVRAPEEFADDHIPGAVNMPVFSDDERAEVGTIFKQDSPFIARKIGAKIACQNIADHLGNHFKDKPQDYSPLVYCWRGGQRSASLATILSAIGWKTFVLEGGYKTYRRMVLEGLEERCPSLNFRVINGLTGSGKTKLLHQLTSEGAQVLDLEGLANHKGSVLGADPGESQPSQKFFESLLWEKISGFDPERPVFAEAESRKVGNLHIPTPIWERLTSSEVTVLKTPLEARVDYLLEDYQHWPESPDQLEGRLDVLRSRYGHETIDAWIAMIRAGEWHDLVRTLLVDHYDVMYSSSTRYPKPAAELQLATVTEPELKQAAAKLLQH